MKPEEMKPVKAWHFARQDRRLGFGDGRLIRAKSALVHRGELELYRSGLHASKNILDALDYSSGPIICRVELSGEMIEVATQIVAMRRKCLWWIDGHELLRKFARICALDVIDLWDAPEIVVRYLKSGGEAIRVAAEAAAEDAAEAAARAAAWSVAGAARAAGDAGDAAWSVAKKTQARRLESMVREKRGD